MENDGHGNVRGDGWVKDLRPRMQYVYCVLPAQITGDLWHLAAACILSREYGKPNSVSAAAADQKAWEERRGDYGLYMRLVPVIVITKHATMKDLSKKKWQDIDIYLAHTEIQQQAGPKDDGYYNAAAFLEDLKEERIHGATTFDYLQNLNLDPMVIILNTAAKPKQAHTKNDMMARTSAFYDEYRIRYEALRKDKSFKTQGEHSFPRFEEVLALATASKGGHDISCKSFGGKRPPHPDNHRVLDYFAATTVVAQAMQNLDRRQWTARVNTLRTRMTKYHKTVASYLKQRHKKLHPNDPAIDPEKEIAEQVAQKVGALLEMVGTEVGQDAGEGAEGAIRRVLLYNHREHRINAQTNSTEDIFRALVKAVDDVDKLNVDGLRRKVDLTGHAMDDRFVKKEYSTRIIIINTSETAFSDRVSLPPESDFDLFGKIKLGGNWVYPGLNPLVTAGFWAEVARRADIFGLFGGRSGSMDVASFMGVSVFWWDAPWLEVAAREPEALRAYGLKPDDVVGWSIREMQARETMPNAPPRRDLRRLKWVREYYEDVVTTMTVQEWANSYWDNENKRDEDDRKTWQDLDKKPSSGASMATNVADKYDQVAQCMRCLQLATVSWVGLPELDLFKSGNQIYPPPWAAMRPYTLQSWLNGQIQHHFVSPRAPDAKSLEIGTYRIRGDPSTPEADDTAKKRQLRWFVRSVPMTGFVGERAMLWPKVDDPEYETWLYWDSVARKDGEPVPIYTKFHSDRILPKGTVHVLRTWYREYKPVPYSNAKARETFEGGLRRPKKTEDLVEEGESEEWEWDPDGPWRVRSDVLEALARARRAGEEKETGKEGEEEKEKEGEKEEKEKEGEKEEKEKEGEGEKEKEKEKDEEKEREGEKEKEREGN